MSFVFKNNKYLSNMSDFEPSSSQSQRNVRGKMKSSAPKRNFSNEEDVRLCKSWRDTSVDSVVGSGQTGDKLWMRIAERFNRRAPSEDCLSRDSEQLETRFRTITRVVNQWHGCWLTALAVKLDSGYTENDRVTIKVLLFKYRNNAYKVYVLITYSH